MNKISILLFAGLTLLGILLLFFTPLLLLPFDTELKDFILQVSSYQPSNLILENTLPYFQYEKDLQQYQWFMLPLLVIISNAIQWIPIAYVINRYWVKRYKSSIV